MNHIRIMIVCLGWLALLGCAAEKLTTEQINAMRVSSVAFLHQAAPPFQVKTERNMIPIQSGLLPELAASIIRGTDTPINLGASVHAQERLVDPASEIQQIVMHILQEKVNPATLHEISGAQQQASVADVLIKTNSDLAFAFKTTEWALQYYGMDTSFYYLIYRGEARLMNFTKSDVTWYATCVYMGEASKNSRPTLDDFLADNATLLKAELSRAAETCAKQLVEKLL
jgi:hypothetical protein